MRLKHLFFLVFIVIFLAFLIYIPLAKKLLQNDISSASSNLLKSSNTSAKEDIKIVPMNPIVMPPVLSNPMAVQQRIQQPVAVKSLTNADEKNHHLRSEFKATDVSYRVHAFYYPWYASKEVNREWSHWNHRTIPHWQPIINAQYPEKVHEPPEDIASRFYPALGPYSSSSPEVIHNHMQQLRKAGVGVISVSWYPPQTKDPNAILFVDDLMPILLDIAHEYSIQVCFHIEPYEKRTALTVKRDIQYIIDTYGKHPAFYRYQNLPLMYLYDSYMIPGGEWATIFQPTGEHTIRGTAYDIVAVGLFVERGHCIQLHEGGFNGFYTYFAARGFVYGSIVENWSTMKQCLLTMQEPHVFAPSVGPGYDDLPVRQWNKGNVHARKNGEYYKDMWKAAIQLRPEIVSVTSFNEWHEGTQIETAVKKEGYEDYGNEPEMYLKLTRKMIGQM